MSERREHNVAVRIGGKTVDLWTDYDVECDMLSPADAFRVSLARASRDVYDLCRPDRAVQVLLDDTIVMTGFIDDREWELSRDGGATLSVTGRDKGGRLTDESAPLLSFAGIGIQQLAEKMAAPWFTKVILSNAENRRLVRGKGARLARVTGEPLFKGSSHRKKIEPGETRWQALASALEEAEILAWSTADGTALVLGQPNYEQEPQYRFFQPGPRSLRAAEGNVLSIKVRHTVAERYSEIIACGTGHGDSSNYGDRVMKRRASATNGAGTDGIGKDFEHRKVLLVSDDDVRTLDLAGVRARREMAERDAGGHVVEVTVRGHGQVPAPGAAPVLYAFDTMALVEIEEIGLRGAYLVTSVGFGMSRDQETTRISMVPKGTVLRS